MNPQPTPNPIPFSATSSRRRRILVVASPDLQGRIGAVIEAAGADADIQTATSFLSAMGAVSQQVPDTIIGTLSAMTGMVSATGQTLRRLAPDARLIVIAQPSERIEAQAAVDAGFDQSLYEPVDATHLFAVLGFGPDPSSGQSLEVQAVETIDSSPEPLPLPESPLGDTDLVQAVQREDQSLPGLAMQLLAAQSGILDVAFAQSADQVPPGRHVVAVRANSEIFGLLHAPPPTTTVQLEPWAAWLSHWLGLENKVASLNKLAMTDELTGVWNRRYFRQFLDQTLKLASENRQPVTLLLFDIDDFKSYNDRYGHPAGDEILRETARLIQTLVRDDDIVARIGGDEFAVVFWDRGVQRQLGSQHPDNVIGIARRFQKAICEHRYPKLGSDAVGQLSVSGGLAGFPWDGQDVDTLIAHADAMAMQSKRQGKNVICFGPSCAPSDQ